MSDDTERTEEADSPSYTDYCLREPRCALCRFRYQDGDLFCAAINKAERIALTFRTRQQVYEDPATCSRFDTDVESEHTDDDEIVFSFHRECYTFASLPCIKYFAPKSISIFFEVTIYQFQPPYHQEKRRFDRTRELLVDRLRPQLQSRFPDEILRMIAQNLVHECAIFVAVKQVHSRHHILPAHSSGQWHPDVDFSRDVYVQYCAIDGVRYVQGLYNEDTPEKEAWEDHPLLSRRLLFRAREAPVRRVIIAEDHLGIRLVRLVSSLDAERISTCHIPGVQWTEILDPGTRPGTWDTGDNPKPQRVGGLEMCLTSDTLKIRNLDPFYQYAKPRVLWSTLEHPHPEQCGLGRIVGEPELHKQKLIRVRRFDCNSPGTTGYSVVTDGRRIFMIHAHRGEDNVECEQRERCCYQDFPPELLWVHMPLDPGECVTEILWIYMEHPHRGKHISTYSLLFATNQGRHTMFGSAPYTPTLSTETAVFKLPEEKPLPIYFNTADPLRGHSGIYWKLEGFDLYNMPDGGSLNKPARLDLGIRLHFNGPYLHSSCGMKGAEEVTVCTDRTLPHAPVLGMQLRYADGHRECVGQFRFDRTRETLRLYASELHIGIIVRAKSMYVAEVRADAPPSESSGSSSISWTHIRGGEDTVEWYFSMRQSYVQRGGS